MFENIISRPLIIFDIESTGLNPRHDRIVELGALKIMPEGEQQTLHERINPQRKIPKEVADLHGISNEDIKDCPVFMDIAGQINRFFRDCDLAGFGIQQFDIPLLQAEFSRVGVTFPAADCRIIDAKTIFHKKEPRDLSAAYRFFCGKDHIDAHGALPDASVTYEVLKGELTKYDDLPRDIEKLHEFCNPNDPNAIDPRGRFRWQDGEVVIGFGKKSGLSLRKVARDEPDYLQWMIRKDFSEEAKAVARDALEGRFPEEKKAES